MKKTLLLLNAKSDDVKVDIDPYKIKTWDSDAIFVNNLKFSSELNVEKPTILKNSSQDQDFNDVKVLFVR